MNGFIFVGSLIAVLTGVGTIETSETMAQGWLGFTLSGLGIAGLMYLASEHIV